MLRATLVLVVLFLLDSIPGLPGMPSPESYFAVWLPLVRTAARDVLGMSSDIAAPMPGSGDTTFAWVYLACQLGIAVVVALSWTIARPVWPGTRVESLVLRSIVRTLLAVNLLAYGSIKVFSSQFGDLGPEFLMTSYGESSPQVLLWAFMGYSDAYETFTGVAELCAGAFLLWRRTTTLGALVAVGVMSNVVMLNYCYDVPVKLLSTLLLILALWLVAFDARRLFDAIVGGRAVAAARDDSWATTPRARRIAVVAKSLFVGANLLAIAQMLLASDDPTDQPAAISGAYAVEEASAQPDARTWRRLIVGPEELLVQWNDGALVRHAFEHDQAAATLAFGPAEHRDAWSRVAYTVDPAGHLEIDGRASQRPFRARLRPIDASDFPLMRFRFRWVSDRDSLWE